MFRFFKRRALGPGDSVVRKGESSFEIFNDDDPAMLEAKERARATQEVFWRRFSDQPPGYTDFNVKAGLTTPNGATEHIWMAVVSRDGDKIIACLLNAPVNLPDLRVGDRVIVDADRLSDWSYFKGDALYGGFTARAAMNLGRTSQEEREYLLRVQSDEPVEKNA